MPIKYPENAVTFPNCRFKALQKPKLRPGGADMSDECAWVFDGLGAGPGGGLGSTKLGKHTVGYPIWIIFNYFYILSQFEGPI